MSYKEIYGLLWGNLSSGGVGSAARSSDNAATVRLSSTVTIVCEVVGVTIVNSGSTIFTKTDKVLTGNIIGKRVKLKQKRILDQSQERVKCDNLLTVALV